MLILVIKININTNININSNINFNININTNINTNINIIINLTNININITNYFSNLPCQIFCGGILSGVCECGAFIVIDQYKVFFLFLVGGKVEVLCLWGILRLAFFHQEDHSTVLYDLICKYVTFSKNNKNNFR